MMQQVLSHYHLPLLSCVGLVLFVGVFVGALAWVFRGGSRRFYSTMESLPFESQMDPEIVRGAAK